MRAVAFDLMSPVTHFFAGWLLASVSPAGRPITLTRREKALIVAAAVAPDIDGIGIIPELLTRNTSHPLLWFSQYHHSLHTLRICLGLHPCGLHHRGPAGQNRPLASAGSVSDFTSAQPFERQRLQPKARQPEARRAAAPHPTPDSRLFWSSSASTCICCAT